MVWLGSCAQGGYSLGCEERWFYKRNLAPSPTGEGGGEVSGLSSAASIRPEITSLGVVEVPLMGEGLVLPTLRLSDRVYFATI